MNKAYYDIKNQCRKGLLVYLKNALSVIPKEGHYRMLDIGCGTGVPTLLLAEHFKGTITAVDTDKPALDFFRDTLIENHLQSNINIREVSFFDFQAENSSFDIILAEGFLNVVGFESGFKKAIAFLKPGGYFIIHDEYKNHENKISFMAHQNCSLMDFFILDENIWWNHYYKELAGQIEKNGSSEMLGYFSRDIAEIEHLKNDPVAFRSVYYLVRKNE
ncbi:MAG: class I SAM-dependent methyltransferase [Bacteroidales bacterium]|nr:class I SAM-dependent methyltransferase [Bacteroidales bacterium]